MCAANIVTARKSRLSWSPRAEWSSDDNWSVFAQPVGASLVDTIANTYLWIFPSDHELDQFRNERLKPRKAGGPDRSTNEIFRSLTKEELAVVREWADRILQDAQSASSVTDDVLNCSIRLLHKGGDTSDKPSDWRPIGLLNVGTHLIHHIINDRSHITLSTYRAKTVEEQDVE